MALVPVTVTIPEASIPDLYLYAAELCQGATDAPDDTAADAGTNGRARAGFGRTTVRRSYFGGQSNVWRPMLDYLAAHPGEWVTWPEVCDAVDRTARQMAGALGAAERRVNGKPPYEKRWNNGVREFRMDETTAGYIREIADDDA